jgi:hypothetical protein
MAIITKPMIDDLELTIRRDTANAEVTVAYKVNWSTFDELTNLSYTERWELVGVDPGGNTTIYTGPSLVGGISSNGNSSTQRTHESTIPWADLNEDPNGLDEIAVVVTLTPLLPVAKSAQSAQVIVTAP